MTSSVKKKNYLLFIWLGIIDCNIGENNNNLTSKNDRKSFEYPNKFSESDQNTEKEFIPTLIVRRV